MEYYKLEHAKQFAKDTVVVNWCLLNSCNYKCSYCPDFLHSGSSEKLDLNIIINFCKKIIKHYKNKNIHFEFTGGEVTYWYGFYDLVTFLKFYENVTVGIISNGSQSLKWWDNIKDKIDNTCLSFHPEFSNKNHYIKVIKLLNNYMKIHINIMMHPNHFNLCLKIAEKIVKDITNVSMALQPLLVDFKDELYEYTEKQKEIITNQGKLYTGKIKWNNYWPSFRGAMKLIGHNTEKVISCHKFIIEKSNNWKGWKCYAGIEQIVIDTNGLVWRGWCLEGGNLGDIKHHVKLPINPIICNREYCHCNFDIMCTKEKP